MKYKILLGEYDADIIPKIEEAIADGWRPTGGISCRPNGYLMQSMVLEETPAPAQQTYALELQDRDGDRLQIEVPTPMECAEGTLAYIETGPGGFFATSAQIDLIIARLEAAK